MKWMTYAIGLLFVLFTLQGVLAVEQNLSDYYNVTTSGDIACLNECKSYIYVTKIQDTKPSDNFNTDIEFEFQNTRFTRKVTNGKNIFTGRFDRQNIGYDIYLKTGETCNNQTVVYENGTEGTETYCQDDLIPFDMSTFLFSIKNTGQTGTIVLVGKKETQDTVKWGITIGDIYIDPLWNGMVGNPVTASVYTQTAYRWTTDQRAVAVSFIPKRNITGITQILFPCGGGSGTKTTIRVGIQTANSNMEPSRNWINDEFYEANVSAVSYYLLMNLSTPVNLTNNTKYSLVMEYASGPANSTNYMECTAMGGMSASTRPKAGVFVKTMESTDVQILTTTNNGTTTWSNDSATTEPRFMLLNETEVLLGQSMESTSITTVRGNTVLAQRMIYENEINITKARVVAWLGDTGQCNITLYITNLTQLSSDWGDDILGECSTNVTSTNRNAYNCTLSTTITIPKRTYFTTIATSNITGTCNTTVILGQQYANGISDAIVGTRISNATFNGTTSHSSSSTNNGSTSTNLTYADMQLAFFATEMISGNVNTTLVSPTIDSNMSQNQWNTFSINITCTGGPCGDAYAYLDPYEITNKKEEVLWCELPRLYSSA